MPSEREMRWHRRFLDLAKHISTWSKDLSTRIGTVIVGPDNEIRSTGYNGLVRGANDNVPERDVRPLKYKWYEHGERNAVYNAARMGVSLKGCRAYLLSLCCTDCARALIQAGIVEIITTPPEYDNPRWGADLRVSKEMLDEVGVKVTIIDTGESTIGTVDDKPGSTTPVPSQEGA